MKKEKKPLEEVTASSRALNASPKAEGCTHNHNCLFSTVLSVNTPFE